jgi:hypothetical protein
MASYNEVLLAQVQQTAACNAVHTMESRLARWLLQTRDRIDNDVLPLTQEFLSQMLGVLPRITIVVSHMHKGGSTPASIANFGALNLAGSILKGSRIYNNRAQSAFRKENGQRGRQTVRCS